MFTKFGLPLLALSGIFFAVYQVVLARQTPPATAPLVEPPARPERVAMIAGSGLIEAQRRTSRSA